MEERVNNGTILCNHFHWADEIDGGIDEVFTEAMDEHKKRIMRMQIKLNSESKKGQMLSVVTLLSWLLCLFGEMICVMSCCTSRG